MTTSSYELIFPSDYFGTESERTFSDSDIRDYSEPRLRSRDYEMESKFQRNKKTNTKYKTAYNAKYSVGQLVYVKKYNESHPNNKIEYKSKRNHNNLSNIISNLEDNTLGINSTNALERTNTIIPQVFDVDTTKDIEDKIKDNNVTYDFTKINNPYITYLEQNNKVSNNAYNICGVIISRFKVLRLYASLSNMSSSIDKLLLFCITYHSKITDQEFTNMKEYVKTIVNEPLIGGRK